MKEQFTRVLAGMYHSRIDYPAASGGITAEFGSPEAKAAPTPPNEPTRGSLPPRLAAETEQVKVR